MPLPRTPESSSSIWIQWRNKEQDGVAFLSIDGRRLEFLSTLKTSLSVILSRPASFIFFQGTNLFFYSIASPDSLRFSTLASRTAQPPHRFSNLSRPLFSSPIAFKSWTMILVIFLVRNVHLPLHHLKTFWIRCNIHIPPIFFARVMKRYLPPGDSAVGGRLSYERDEA